MLAPCDLKALGISGMSASQYASPPVRVDSRAMQIYVDIWLIGMITYIVC